MNKYNQVTIDIYNRLKETEIIPQDFQFELDARINANKDIQDILDKYMFSFQDIKDIYSSYISEQEENIAKTLVEKMFNSTVKATRIQVEKYLRSNLDIKNFSIYIEKEIKLGEFDFSSFVNNVSIGDFPDTVKEALEDYPKDAKIKVEYYGYDGGWTAIIVQNQRLPESEKETLARMTKVILPKLKKLYDIEKAKKLIKEEG